MRGISHASRAIDLSISETGCEIAFAVVQSYIQREENMIYSLFVKYYSLMLCEVFFAPSVDDVDCSLQC